MTSQDIDNLDQILADTMPALKPTLTPQEIMLISPSLQEAKAALLKWRDRAVVAELKKYQPRISKLEGELIDINNILLDCIKQLGAE